MKQYFSNRFWEPSTYAGLGAVVEAIHLILVKDYSVGIPALFAGLAAMFGADPGSKKN